MLRFLQLARRSEKVLSYALTTLFSALGAALLIGQFVSEKGTLLHMCRGALLLFVALLVVALNTSTFVITWDIPWLLHFVPGVVFFAGVLVLCATGIYAKYNDAPIWRGHKTTAMTTTAMYALALLGAVLMPILR